jgi:hypothetical protein
VENAAVLSARKIRLNPTPCHTCGSRMSQNPRSLVRCESDQNE